VLGATGRREAGELVEPGGLRTSLSERAGQGAALFLNGEGSVMGEQTIQLQGLIVRLHGGDDSARRELIRCAYDRLRRLAAVVLNESFPRLKRAPALVDTTDLANEVALKLYEALADVQPQSVHDFLRLAAQRMRWLLLDLARRADRSEERQRETPGAEAVEPTPSENSLSATLAALYQQIEELPEKEREVVDLLYFHGLSQAEAAALLGTAERTVRRHWTAAKVKLFEGLKDFLPGAVAPDAHG
jgi:RNA polymerase sigma-70 factor (ECF subfamily)